MVLLLLVLVVAVPSLLLRDVSRSIRDKISGNFSVVVGSLKHFDKRDFCRERDGGDERVTTTARCRSV